MLHARCACKLSIPFSHTLGLSGSGWGVSRMSCLKIFCCPAAWSPAIPADHFGMREDVALHGTLYVGFCRTSFQIQLRIQRVELEEIPVRIARRRARPSVADLAEVVAALPRAIRNLFLLRH